MVDGVFQQIELFFRRDVSRSKWGFYLGTSVSAGIVAVALHAAGNSQTREFGAGFLLAGASLFAGVVVGFIFGIPKSSKSSEGSMPYHGSSTDHFAYTPNTNLEDISDWLTKMLIGDFIEQDPRRLINSLIDDIAQTVQSDPNITSRSLDQQVVSAQELRAAEAIAKISSASNVSLEDLRAQIGILAAKYESIRATMPRGDARTREMEIVASQMRGYALAAFQLLPEYTRSDSPGKRLAGIAFLETKPDSRYFEWLADRFRIEVPFLQYHAAIALRNAVKQKSFSEHKDSLRVCCKNALQFALQSAESNNGDLKSDQILVLRDALSLLGS